MALRRRPRGSERGEPGSSRPTQQDVYASPDEPRGRRRKRAEEPVARVEPPPPEMFTGTTIEPEEGAAGRISSAVDVDPNFKRFGVLGGPGGAGGYGGAGTK